MILLLASENQPALKNIEIAKAAGLTKISLERPRKRSHEVGPNGELATRLRNTPPLKIKITGKIEAPITQLAASQTP